MVLNMSRTTLKKFDFFKIFADFSRFFGHFCPRAPMSIFFWKIIGTKKMREVCTINLVAVRGRELCYVSENEGFRFLKKGHF